MKITMEQFDAAIVHILGQEHASLIKNRTSRANAAINKIFMESIEVDAPVIDKTGDLKACKTIKEGMKRLGEKGHFYWDE